MAYDVVTVSCVEDMWETLLLHELARLEAEGWTVCAMTTRTVQIQQTGGMGATTRQEEQLVVVVHKAGEA